MITLTNEEKKLPRKQEVCHICRKRFFTNDDNKKYQKVKDHCHLTGKYRGAAHIICNLRYKVPKEILVVFHNVSTYNYHFLIKELSEKFEGVLEKTKKNI